MLKLNFARKKGKSLINQGFLIKNNDYRFNTYCIKIIVLIWCGRQVNEVKTVNNCFYRRARVRQGVSEVGLAPRARRLCLRAVGEPEIAEQSTAFKSVPRHEKKQSSFEDCSWCGRQDLNLHGNPPDPKSGASASSATPAFPYIFYHRRARMSIVTFQLF